LKKPKEMAMVARGRMEAALLVVVMMLVVGVLGRERCTTDQQRKMQADFRECSAGFTGKSELSACDIITNVINVCGKSWTTCYGHKEVRQMKDSHIRRYEEQYGDENGLKNCQITEELRSSGRKTNEEVGPFCSDTKTRQVQQDFQKCSHEEATQLYTASLDMPSGDSTLEQLLCQALKTTLTTCIEKLSECFGGDDVEQMRATTETDQKAFLVRIMDGKVSAEAANRCGVKVEKKTVPIPPVVMMGGPGSEAPILPIGSAVDKLHHQLQEGAVFNSVVEEEEEMEPPIADVMVENSPPIGDVMGESQPPIGDIMEEDEDAGLGAQMGWESLASSKMEEKERVAEVKKKEEASAQKQSAGVVHLVQPNPSFKSNSASSLVAAFSLLCLLLPLLVV